MSNGNAYDWAVQLIGKLGALWPIADTTHFDLVFAKDDHEVWALHDGVADGACHVTAERITIYLRQHATDTEYWRDVLIHEYAHAVVGVLLVPAPGDVSVGAEEYAKSAYVQKVEDAITRLAGLLEYAVRTGAAARVAA